MASLAKKRSGVGSSLALYICDLERQKVRRLNMKTVLSKKILASSTQWWKIYLTHLWFDSSFLPYFYMTSFQNFACVQHILLCIEQILTHQNKPENMTLYKLTFGLRRGKKLLGLRNSQWRKAASAASGRDTKALITQMNFSPCVEPHKR